MIKRPNLKLTTGGLASITPEDWASVTDLKDISQERHLFVPLNLPVCGTTI
jgi:hypothetical protein